MSHPALLRDLFFTLAAHALLAGYRSVCAVRETIAIAWEHLTAPASLAEDDPLDGRYRQAADEADHA